MFQILNVHWFVLILASTVFGALALIVKKKGLEHEHSMEYLTIFKVFELLIMIPIIPFLNFGYPLMTYIWLYILSIFITTGLYIQDKGMRRTEFSQAIPILSMRTIITIIASMIILKEYLTIPQWIGAGIITYSIYKIHAKKTILKTIKTFETEGLVYLLLSCIFLGITMVYEKQLLITTNVLSYLVIMYAFGLLNSFTALTILRNGYKGVLHGIRKEGKMILLAAVFSTISNILFLTGLQTAYVAIAEIIRKFSTVLSMLIGKRYFHEKEYTKRLLWTLVACAGLILIAL